MAKMSDAPFKLQNAPIVEAVLDIDCDLPPATDMAALEKPAREAFAATYPNFRTKFFQRHRMEAANEGPTLRPLDKGIRAFQFIQEGEKQLVQIRSEGFSFNRLKPYGSLDDYLPEIERTWSLFRQVAKPVSIRKIGLRYINRILLPTTGRRAELGNYFRVCPHLPDERRLTFVGFLNQHTAMEEKTGNLVNIVLTVQPLEDERLPIIFDIEAIAPQVSDEMDWPAVAAKVDSLRDLKNHVFRNTLTDECLKLFH